MPEYWVFFTMQIWTANNMCAMTFKHKRWTSLVLKYFLPPQTVKLSFAWICCHQGFTFFCRLISNKGKHACWGRVFHNEGMCCLSALYFLLSLKHTRRNSHTSKFACVCACIKSRLCVAYILVYCCCLRT